LSPRSEHEQGGEEGEEGQSQYRAEVLTRAVPSKLCHSPMRHSGSGFAQSKLQARVQGNLAHLAHSTSPDEAGVHERDAGTGNVREVMHGAWAVGVNGMVQEDTDWAAVVTRKDAELLERGFGSTRSRPPEPVAVQTERGQCFRAQCCHS